jgi:hypothetical protein
MYVQVHLSAIITDGNHLSEAWFDAIYSQTEVTELWYELWGEVDRKVCGMVKYVQQHMSAMSTSARSS